MDVESPYVPIDCGLYDYLEIACLHAYEVELDLRNGEKIKGDALTTRIEQSCEFLVIQTASDARSVRLDSIITLHVLSRPCQFDNVSFD